MAKRRKPKPGPPQHGHPGLGTDGVLELDRFSGADLDRWNRLSLTLDQLYNQLYFGFEGQRHTVRRELVEALQAGGSRPLDFERWCRIVPHRFSLMPLSAAGSLRGVGGRFNVGIDIPGDVRSPWPALYVAADQETALREKYGPAAELASMAGAIRIACAWSNIRSHRHRRGLRGHPLSLVQVGGALCGDLSAKSLQLAKLRRTRRLSSAGNQAHQA